MPDKHLFEYAVLRVVPRVEREEFLNVGVIVYCRSQGFLACRFEVPEARLRAFAAAELDLADVAERLRSFERICRGRKEGGPIGQMGVAERFRWLTATRSTIIQTSAVHPGMCTDAGVALDRLYAQLVG
ncbi:DUF3037 domain-containing protein [Hymenobacter latericus]|uniref:DUF3037 domain-containing protein n=1 Tax=Hymenobacter sp. YIM 151858-1 TaxID=2987688 RepID=UPI0022269775|nr:DUF3037 domain-containing protein [Hymenobacter sp. YIM 151858-1]UYZ60217.1 DUF3037 domain-containing protein [Hymenobacter sp. YIM 151858-1]